MAKLESIVPTAGVPLIAAIVNATGDSFSEGAASSPADAAERALRLLDEGADMLDLGGESTRPGSAEVPPEEEMRRILPVLETVLRAEPGCVVSIDTRHAATARAALERGAAVINDVSMLRADPAMAATVAEFGAGLVLCHSRGTPAEMQQPEFRVYPQGVTAGVIAELAEAARRAREAGVKVIWYDPGFGFAKSVEDNFTLMREISAASFPGPLYVGVSRKSFIGAATGETVPARRLGGTLAAELFLARRGAAVIRTHEPGALRQALAVARILEGGAHV